MNEKFQNALSKKAQKVPPIWFMRQAGRYHSHYQKLKEKYTFIQLCKEPELAAEVALGPVLDFDYDVSILFSDLLFPLEALGFGLDYAPGPVLSMTLDESSIKKLRSIDDALPHLQFQKKAMELTRQVLPKNKSLIGFVGGPWTLFTYAREGGHSGSLQDAKTKLQLYNDFSKIMVPLLKKNIQLQFDGGAEVVMIFDTSSGELDPITYNQYVAPHLKELSKAFPNKLGYYSKGTMWAHLQDVAKFEWAGMGFDHRWALPEVFNLKTPGFVQGNFDQALLFSDTADFKKHVTEYTKPLLDLSPERRAGWVSGLGHGVLPKTPEANVRAFVEIIRKTFG